MQPIFVKTRHEYGSYQYYFKLVELSGFETIYIDEVQPQSDNVYIISMLNGEWLHGWDNPRATIIWWDLEWRLDDYTIPSGVARVWASDRWYADKIGAQYVPLGSHPDLMQNPLQNVKIAYDVAFICAMNGRRYQLEADFKHVGLSLMPNDWVAERDTWLQQTQLMVHTHQHGNVLAISPLRAAVAAAYRLPLLAELSHDAGFIADVIAQANTPHLAHMAQLLLQNPALLDTMARGLHQRLCVDNTFASLVRGAL